MKLRRVVVSIYIDPDFYPPTINAILNLAEIFEEVIVISRNNINQNFPYPPNVKIKKIGNFCVVREMERQTVWKKMVYYLRFVFCFKKYAKNHKTDLVVIYDHFALFAFYLVRHICKNTKIWYHNHDMVDKNLVNKYSIGGLAAKFENKAMDDISFFSLPAKERIQYYGEIRNELPVFIIPNYPSLKVYNTIKESKLKDVIKIIYQGFIGKGHSLEEIIELLPETIVGCNLQLTLKGSVTDEYRSFLDEKAKKLGVSNRLIWLPIGPYSEMPCITSSMDIGIGINSNIDMVSLAQGTASNKIYEYSASGLPVILFDSDQFREYLGQYNWAFFTNGSVDSLREKIREIIANLEDLGVAARQDFENDLNFETVFQPVLQKIIDVEV